MFVSHSSEPNPSLPGAAGAGRINPDISLFWGSTEIQLIHFHLPLLKCCGHWGPPAEVGISISQQCLMQVGSWHQHPGPGQFLSEPSAWGERLWFIHHRLLWSSRSGRPHHFCFCSGIPAASWLVKTWALANCFCLDEKQLMPISSIFGPAL